MNYLRELGILLAVCAAGDVLSAAIGGVLPGNILGMTLLLVLLGIGLIKVGNVEHACDFFLKNMMIFFLPISLGILEVYHDLQNQLVAIIAVCLITTFLTALATAGTVHLVLHLQQRGKPRGGKQI